MNTNEMTENPVGAVLRKPIGRGGVAYAGMAPLVQYAMGFLVWATAFAGAAATPDAPFCTNVVQNFPEEPTSLKCIPVPQPTLDAAGTQPISPNILKSGNGAQTALIALGKALFWDQQVGSDGQACASCHYKAGADDRIKNQIDPGLRNASGKWASDGKTAIGKVFNYTGSNPLNADPLGPAPGKGPNYTLKKTDFPLRKYHERDTTATDAFPPQNDRNAPVEFDSDDVISSQGVFLSKFNALSEKGKKEKCNTRFPTSGPDVPLFNVQGISVRQVEPRNAPTTINAVFNFRNFWDGRANNVFNGLDPFGMHRPFPMPPDPDPAVSRPTEIQVWDSKTRSFTKTRIAIFNSSLASQAVGPALSDFEMSCGGKSFPELGKKMLSLKPLRGQKVRGDDSVLGSFGGESGLKTDYASLIKAAFADIYWNAPPTQLIDGYTQIQNNFSLFWGLAIQAYERTLVSDDSRFDQMREGKIAFSDAEARGESVFFNQGKCIACHLGPEFTAASVTHVANADNAQDIGKYTERMLMGDGGIAIYDSGFYNIGVRPTEEDVGVGGTDPYGYPLSFSRNAKNSADGWTTDSPLFPDPFQTNSFTFASDIPPIQWNPETTGGFGALFGTSAIASDERDAVDGAFKTPTLRNVELTGPFFHNGGQATLEQVVEFYNRGGDRRDKYRVDTDCGKAALTTDPFGNFVVEAGPDGLIDDSGFFDPKTGRGYPSNLDPDLAGAKILGDSTCNAAQPEPQHLGLTKQDAADLVAYLKTLTDERVRWEKAPFDHPELNIPNGHPGDEVSIRSFHHDDKENRNVADDVMLKIPAVGRNGRADKAARLPALLPFEASLK